MAKQLMRWILATLLVAAVIFIAAGTIRDPWLGAYVAVCSLITAYAMFSIDDDLAKERFHPPTQGADASALRVVRIVAFLHLVVGAADVGRWHLATSVPPSVRAGSLVAMAVSLGMFYRAMRENRFFSSVVRIQGERGHHVIDTGPYRVVRHPGYAGMVVGMPLSGLALGSWFAVALGVVLSGCILRRVMFEDAFLRKNLDGYVAYARRVPYRLVPGLW